MALTKDGNDRRRLDAEPMIARDAEVAAMRRAGVPFRVIAERLNMSLGAVQKALRRAQKRAAAAALGAPGHVMAMIDTDLTAEDVAGNPDQWPRLVGAVSVASHRSRPWHLAADPRRRPRPVLCRARHRPRLATRRSRQCVASVAT